MWRADMRRLLVAVTVAGAAALAAVAYADVTFDPATGTGFVGKGDVQSAFGWNNKQLQNNATAGYVRFAYVEAITTIIECRDVILTVPPGPPTFVFANGYRIHGVATALHYLARTHNQIDGFILLGYGNMEDVFQTPPQCPDGYTPFGPPLDVIVAPVALEVIYDVTPNSNPSDDTIHNLITY